MDKKLRNQYYYISSLFYWRIDGKIEQIGFEESERSPKSSRGGRGAWVLAAIFIAENQGWFGPATSPKFSGHEGLFLQPVRYRLDQAGLRSLLNKKSPCDCFSGGSHRFQKIQFCVTDFGKVQMQNYQLCRGIYGFIIDFCVRKRNPNSKIS